MIMDIEDLKKDMMAVLEEEVDVFRKMHGLLTQEQKALTRDDVEGIKSAVENQKQLGEAVRLVDARRDQIAKAIGLKIGVGEEPMTINRLCELYDGEEGERMLELRDSLLDLQAEIRRVNRNNAFLIRHAMRYVDKIMFLLKSGDGSSRIYLPSGAADSVSAGMRPAVNRTA